MTKSRRVAVYFGKKDNDLLSWIHKVPERLVATLVRIALAHYLQNQPLSLGTVCIENKELPPKCLNLRFTKSMDPELYDWAGKLPKGLASVTIKNVLRECISFTTNPEEENVDLLPGVTLAELPQEETSSMEEYAEEFAATEEDILSGLAITPK